MTKWHDLAPLVAFLKSHKATSCVHRHGSWQGWIGEHAAHWRSKSNSVSSLRSLCYPGGKDLCRAELHTRGCPLGCSGGLRNGCIGRMIGRTFPLRSWHFLSRGSPLQHQLRSSDISRLVGGESVEFHVSSSTGDETKLQLVANTNGPGREEHGIEQGSIEIRSKVPPENDAVSEDRIAGRRGVRRRPVQQLPRNLGRGISSTPQNHLPRRRHGLLICSSGAGGCCSVASSCRILSTTASPLLVFRWFCPWALEVES